MVNINILTYLNHSLFDQQFDKSRFSKQFNFYQNSTLDIEWDMVVIFEAINKIRTIKCKKGALVFIAGEPPMVSIFTSSFLKQFDTIFISNPKIKNSKNIIRKQFFNDWHFGFDNSEKKHVFTFEELSQMKIPNKTKNISVITSSLAVLPFHLKRLDFINKVKDVFGDKIDYFGKGFNFVNDKKDAILPYRFHLCIENTCINDLWTEKFADPLLGFSIPIYIGCTNMEQYFPNDSFYFLNINDINGSINILNEILSDPVNCYNRKLDNLIMARNLLLNNYNIYPTLVNLYLSNQQNFGDVITSTIQPNFDSVEFRFKNYLLRLNRFIYKKIFFFKK